MGRFSELRFWKSSKASPAGSATSIADGTEESPAGPATSTADGTEGSPAGPATSTADGTEGSPAGPATSTADGADGTEDGTHGTSPPADQPSSDNTGPIVFFPPKTKDHGVKVDLVFVHGLRGDRIKTWKRGNVCWPRDLLGEDLPGARIITWGYDSKVANFLHAASQENIYGHADTLLTQLSNLRQEARHSSRPIIFVAHSLGGLVVKEALIKSAMYDSHNRFPRAATIYRNTRAIIFCGTPHRGSGKAEDWGEIILLAAGLALRGPNKGLLRTLRSDSHILQSQRDNFTTISKNLDVVCLREELKSTIGMIVPEVSASYDGFNVRKGSIRADHSDMVKFSRKSDTGYQTILELLKEFSNGAEAPAEDQTGELPRASPSSAEGDRGGSSVNYSGSNTQGIQSITTGSGSADVAQHQIVYRPNQIIGKGN